MKNRFASAAVILVALPVIGYGSVYGWSEARLKSHENLPTFDAPIPTDSTSLARGAHIARTRGCRGCHGEQLQGQELTWSEDGRTVAPNLAQLAREYDAVELAGAIRAGIGLNGKALWTMPSYNFAHLTDADLAAVIGFLRSAPVVEVDLPSPSLKFSTRLALVRGEQMHMADQVAALPPLVVGPGEPEGLARGEYLAMTTCNECHGLDLRGVAFPNFVTPDLAIVAAYPWDDFRRLMQEGVGLGGRELRALMRNVAKNRLSHFGEDELRELYAFLQSLPGRPYETDVFWRAESN